MSKRLKIIGVSAIAALFVFAACEGPTGPGGGAGPTGPTGPQGNAIVSSYLRVITSGDFQGVHAEVVGNVLVWNAMDYIPTDEWRDPAVYFTPTFILENFSDTREDLTVSFTTLAMNVSGTGPANWAAQVGTGAGPFRLLVLNEDGYALNTLGEWVPLTFAGANADEGNLIMTGLAQSVVLQPGETATISMVPFNAGSLLGQTELRAYIQLSYSLPEAAFRTLRVPMVLFRQRAATDVTTIQSGMTDHTANTSASHTGNLTWASADMTGSPDHNVTTDFSRINPTGFIVQSMFTGNPGIAAPVGDAAGLARPVALGTLPPPLLGVTVADVDVAAAAAPLPEIGVSATTGFPLRNMLVNANAAPGWHWVSVISRGGALSPVYHGNPDLGTRVVSLNAPRVTPFHVFVPHPMPSTSITVTADGVASIVRTGAAPTPTTWAFPVIHHVYRSLPGGLPVRIFSVTQSAASGDGALGLPILVDLRASTAADVLLSNQQGLTGAAVVALPTGAPRLFPNAFNNITVRTQPTLGDGVMGMTATSLHGLSNHSNAMTFHYFPR